MSYGSKLACLSLAAFFIVHCAAAILAGWLSPFAIRAAERMRARSAARFLLTVRFAPVAIALFVVAALCIPSYLRFEPEPVSEETGAACVIAAALCVAVWAISLMRAVRAILRSREVHGIAVGLTGVVRPRVVVAREVHRLLSPEELDAALLHERAHAVAHDNLKRLLILLAPDAVPFFRGGLASLERAWKKFAEWSADDQAAHGGRDRSLALAAALVHIARLAPAPHAPLVTSLVEGDLSARVDRLLNAAPPGEPDRWTPAVCALSALALAAVILQPGALIAVYELLERLIQLSA